MIRIVSLIAVALLWGGARAPLNVPDAGSSDAGCALQLSLYDWRVRNTPFAVCAHGDQRVLRDLGEQLRIAPAARIDLEMPGVPSSQPFKFGTLNDFGSASLVDGMTIVLERQHRLMPDLRLVGTGCRRELRSASEGFICNAYVHPLPKRRTEFADCVSNECDAKRQAAAQRARAPDPYNVCIGSACSPPTPGGASLGFGQYYVENEAGAFEVACEGAAAYHNEGWASIRSGCNPSEARQK